MGQTSQNFSGGSSGRRNQWHSIRSSTAASVAGSNDGGDVGFRANELKEQIVSQGLPPYTELTRQGDRWKVAIATPIAAIVALPTTLANLEIKNQTSNLSFVVDAIWSWQLLGTAVVWSHTPWAQVGVAAQSAITGLVVYNSNGTAGYTSTAATPLGTAITQTVVANGWEVFPGSTMNFGLAAATPGGANVGMVDGRLIVPPGKALHVSVTGSVNTASAFHCGASGYFAAITNE